MNILQRIALHARDRPRAAAIVTTDRTIGYRQLVALVGGMAQQLAQQGVSRGDVVAISRVTPREHLLALLALAYLGAVSASFGPSYSAPALEAAVRKHAIRFWIHGPGDTWSGTEDLVRIAVETVTAPLAAGARARRIEHVDADHPLRLLMSSGTTGQSKGILWTHGQRSLLEARVLDFHAGGPGERLLVQADVGAGFVHSPLMAQLASGGAVVLALSTLAEGFFDLAEATRPTRVLAPTSGAFNMAQLGRSLRGGQGPLPGLLSLNLAGAAVPPALLAALEATVCPNVVTIYGATEVGTIARDDLAARLAHPGSAGRLLPLVEAEAVDDDGRPLPAGESGLLRYRSEGMASGYHGDEEATQKAFRGGWFYPGDRGAIVDRHVMLAGRDDERINLDGTKIDPAAIERLVNAQPGVLESGVTVVLRNKLGRKSLAVAIVADADAGEQPDLRAIGEHVKAHARVAGSYVLVKSLPRTPAGKLDRRALGRAIVTMAKGSAGT